MNACPSCGKAAHLVVYVSGPYSRQGDTTEFAHIMRARTAGLALRAAGFIPLVPHVAILLDEPEKFSYHDAIRECLCILRKCDRMLMLADWQTSNGAKVEHHYAQELKIPIAYSLDELVLRELPATSKQ